MQALRQKHCDDIGLKDGGVVGPSQRFDDVGAKGSTQFKRIAARHHELREIYNDGYLPRRERAAQRLEIEGPQEIAVDELESRSRLPRLSHRERFRPQDLLQPLAPVFRAPSGPDTSSPVILKHDIVALEHDFLEERLHRQLARPGGARGRNHVEYVPVQDELRDRP